ncbi:hypothetical protein CPB86DRAFT_758665 [Serendipita vermifera]|nr:hypothetical protein CPB86DRAFT_758665 [Serendipita vermifera]
MSRRESRSSLGARQSNALEEFENFKKKYLLVNKHIAKLNSSLNVRIEELLTQIAALNIDNLRLRASELSLARKLEDEQENTRRLYRETESASRFFASQLSNIRINFGFDKPPGPSPIREIGGGTRQKVTRPPPPPLNCRLARPPEIEMIMEASEEEIIAATAPYPRESPQSSADPSKPTSRRRSSGSTASTPTPTKNAEDSPGGAGTGQAQGRKSDENRRSSAVSSMDITTGSSPLTSCPSSSVGNTTASPSPSPRTPPSRSEGQTSPTSTHKPPKIALSGDQEDGNPKTISSIGLTGPISVPHLNLNGMKRIIRRPSGLLMSDANTPVEKDQLSTQVNASSTKSGASVVSPSYPTPISAVAEPSTPPKVPSSLTVPGSTSPVTPTKSLALSPVLTANPALSPPPARKISLTRRQLDFGIVDPDETSSDEAEAEAAENDNVTATGLLDLQSESVVGKRAAKRKEPEEDINEPTSFTKARISRKHEKRRDTGDVLTSMATKEKELVLKERESKESLRDVTNGQPTSHQAETNTEDTNNQAIPQSNPATHGKSHVLSVGKGTVADITAKLEKLSSRPKPVAALTPMPLPSSDKDVKVSLPEEDKQPENSNENATTVGADLMRRESGRQRKSVNYKEPSLLSKMRKPDPVSSASSSAPSSSSSAEASMITQRPPKRKKGSLSLIGDVISDNGSMVNPTEVDVKPRLSSKGGRGEIDGVENTPRFRRAVWDMHIDLSDEEDGKQDANDTSYTPASESRGTSFSFNGSRFSFDSLNSLRGTSILNRGSNPIILSSPAGSVTNRSTAALRLAPGLARERIRGELVGVKRDRDREREREPDKEGQKEGGGIAA